MITNLVNKLKCWYN